MFEQELKEIGLSDNESKLYLCLLQCGAQNPTELAKKTGLHRSYVYDTVERLLDKGIINTVLVKGKKQYQPVDPRSLREQFELKIQHINTILPQLMGLFQQAKEETRIALHKGPFVYRTLIRDIVTNIRKGDTILSIGIKEDLLESVEPIYVKQYFTTITTKGVKEKAIIGKGWKRLDEPSLTYKEIDDSYLGQTATVVYQNKVFIFIWGTPHYLIAIESQQVADTYQRQFEVLWNLK